jgi:hypothetical protein
VSDTLNFPGLEARTICNFPDSKLIIFIRTFVFGEDCWSHLDKASCFRVLWHDHLFSATTGWAHICALMSAIGSQVRAGRSASHSFATTR